MREDFLHYLWRLKRFDLSDLKTTRGEPIEIQYTGDYNSHGGPDFLNARIRIGPTLWAGNVEMHLRSSDWLRHRHQEDGAYDNVILHVVLEEDEPVVRTGGETLPCLELRSRIPPRLSGIYRKLLQEESWIPCQNQFCRVPEITRQLWLDRLLVERLEEKTALLRQQLERNRRDWEETFYQALARGFGVRINAQPFGQLARSLPLNLLMRHKTSLFQIEALLFGQAGLLAGEQTDEYPRRLAGEFRHLANKYRLTPLPEASWKFLRLRPANFPTLRIAQFATLLYQSGHLFSKMLAAANVREIEHMFEVRLSNYWKNHYVFGKESPRRVKALGRATIHLFVINTIVPFLFLYGRERLEEAYCERALRLLEELPPEDNHLIRKWRELGVEPNTAYQTQALLRLKNEYCSNRACLRCAIGNAIIR